MKFDIITIFPDFFRGPLDYGIVRRAREAGLIDITIHDLLRPAAPVLPDVLQRAGACGSLRFGCSPRSRASRHRTTRCPRACSKGAAGSSTGRQRQPAI